MITELVKPYYQKVRDLIDKSKYREAEQELYSLPVKVYDLMCIYANQERLYDELFEELEKRRKTESQYFLSKRRELEEAQGIRYQFEVQVPPKVMGIIYDESNQILQF